MKKIIYALVLASIFFAPACKKDNKGGIQPSKVGTTLQLVEDSIYLHALEEYYWNTSLPSFATFNPRATTPGTTDVATLTNEVNKLSQYAINPATSLPYEYYSASPGEAKYSFIDNGQISTELSGTNGDFGFAPLYNTTTDLRVKYVYAGSPADLAGIKRGYQITAINGNSTLTYDGDSGTNTNFVINAVFYSNSLTMTLKKPDSTSFNVSLSTANYTINPVITYKTFKQTNGHTVGYMVFNSFTSDANADPQLNTAMNYFISQGVTDLVVDLRYNGGGYISTAEYLDNLIVPAAKSGTLMYNTYYNQILQNGKQVLIPKYDFSVAGNAVNFAKKGSLNVNRVFFIVTGSTASASELTINNLRPEMDVQFIGTTSYGKPVGFFAIDINVYQLYIPEFAVQNSAGQGGYYTGMTPGTTTYPGVEDYDDVTKDFGDPTEGLLAHALNYVQNGTYSVVPNAATSLTRSLVRKSFTFAQHNALEVAMDHKKFMGMIGTKPAGSKK